jgi:hypothetical protein
MKPTKSPQNFNRLSLRPPVPDEGTRARKRAVLMQKAGWLFCCGLLAGHLQGATFTVTNTSDSVPALPGSLRQAILNANAASGDDIIQILAVGTIVLATNLPAITDNVTITGPGINLLTISASNQFGVFVMTSGTTNTLSGLTISDGALTNWTSLPPSLLGGAGISNAGSLKLLSCGIRNCTFESWVQGGGIYNAGDLSMKNCEVTGCHASWFSTFSGSGGGIANSGDLRMEGCIVSACSAGNGGGIYSTSNLFLTNCVIMNCNACDQGEFGSGGGIYGSGTIHSCTISNCNACADGGGICGQVAMTNSTLVGNSAYYDGGGLAGGGIVVGCTIARNGAGCGGGVSHADVLSLFNCTISGNGNTYYGSEISNGVGWPPWCPAVNTNATIHMDHCTVICNTNWPLYPDQIGVLSAGVFYSRNSIFAAYFSGVLSSEGNNLIQTTSGCSIAGVQTGNIYGKDPLLGPLQDNGGPTWTDALLPGSPAIDAGSSAGGPALDQRGIHRPQGLAPDIGAFEFEYAPPVLTRIAVQSHTNCCVTLCGLSSGIYTLQDSTNLVNWFNVATNTADTNGVCVFTEMGAAKGSRLFYRVLLPGSPGSVYIPAPSGIVDAPFVVTNTYIWQATLTSITNAGRAEYPFIIPKAGSYILQAKVNAPGASANSFFVNIDAEPQDPTMTWDVSPYTSVSGFEQRTVNWRGGGTDTNDQLVPIVFTLSQGSHKLIIRGREAYTSLQDMTIVPYPAVYIPVTSGTVAAPFIITNSYIYQTIQTTVVADGGRAALNFIITNAGTYAIQAMVNAPETSANSFFLNMDAEPQAPTMIWDIFPCTLGFEPRLVSWRGSGTDTNNQFAPQVFNLSAGAHQLIIRGREANAQLQSMTIRQFP